MEQKNVRFMIEGLFVSVCGGKCERLADFIVAVVSSACSSSSR